MLLIMQKGTNHFNNRFPLIEFNPPVTANRRRFVDKHIHINALSLCCSIYGKESSNCWVFAKIWWDSASKSSRHAIGRSPALNLRSCNRHKFTSSVSNPGFPEPETRFFWLFSTTRNPFFSI